MKKKKKKTVSRKKKNKTEIRVLNTTYEVDINEDLDCDDALLEACTQLLEENIKNENYNVSPFMEVTHNDELHFYNTYKVLINGSLHHYAENLRKLFKKRWKIDLKDEPTKSNI